MRLSRFLLGTAVPRTIVLRALVVGAAMIGTLGGAPLLAAAEPTPTAATISTAAAPTTAVPTTAVPTTAVPTAAAPTTAVPTTAVPTAAVPTAGAATADAPFADPPTAAVSTADAPIAGTAMADAPTVATIGNEMGTRDVAITTTDGRLTATFSDQADDAALLRAVPGLIALRVRSVSLRGAPIQDIGPLARMIGLETLDLSGTQVRELAPLAWLIGLRSLNLQFLPIRDLTALTHLADLRALNISGTDVSDLTPLAGLTKLHEVLAAVSRVTDLSPLAPLHQLVSLDFDSTSVSDIWPLSGMVALRYLCLNGTQVSDLRPLGSLTDLRELDLGGSQVSDLRPLATLHALRALDVEGTQVADVTPLAGLTALRSLAIGGSLVRDPGRLSNLTGESAPPRADPPGGDPVRATDGTTPRDATQGAADPATANPRIAGPATASASDAGAPKAGAWAGNAWAMKAWGADASTETPLAAPLGAGRSAPTNAADGDPAPGNQAGPDQVLIWNDHTVRAIQATAADAYTASRDLALESIAVLDTVNSLLGEPGFLVRLPAPGQVPMGAAIAAAAHTVLVHLFPTQQAALDTALTTAFATEPDDPSRRQAIALGTAVAGAVIAMRAGDGWDGAGSVRGGVQTGIGPGKWRPTASDKMPPVELPREEPPPVDLQSAAPEPFVLIAPDQFRPSGPPAPGSAAFNTAREAVATLGGAASRLRTAEQTAIARYWSGAAGAPGPASQWNTIAASVVAPQMLGVVREARLFAELNLAMADAGVATGDAAATYSSWRPVTAIRGGGDGAPAIPAWTPLLAAPNRPGYVSGRASFAGAAAVVLTAWLGPHKFSLSSTGLPGVIRRFASFQQAAEDVAISRVYSGTQYPFDTADGLAVGRAVGAWTLSVFQRRAADHGPFLMAQRPLGTDGTTSHAVMGCALDNVAPVTLVMARLDGGVPFVLTVDDRGLFELPPQRFSAPGRHEVVLTATSATGRSNAVRVELGL